MRRLLLMLCLLVLPALAQEEWVEVEISVTKPSSVLVVPGGKPDKVRLYGRGFELVKEVQVHRNSSRVKSLQGKLRMVSQGIADLEVTATPEAEVGTDYTLVFFTPTHSYPMSLEVEVSDPNE